MVLMVDDEPKILNQMKYYLEIEDIEFNSFENPEDFINECKEELFEKIEIFICDYSMLPFNGYEAIKKITDKFPNKLPKHSYLFTGNSNQIPIHEKNELNNLGVIIISKTDNELFKIIDEFYGL